MAQYITKQELDEAINHAVNHAVNNLRIEFATARMEIIEVNETILKQMDALRIAVAALTERRVKFISSTCSTTALMHSSTI
jgi:maleate cis-trans isomerase